MTSEEYFKPKLLVLMFLIISESTNILPYLCPDQLLEEEVDR